MIDEDLLEKTRTHVRRWFARHMPPEYEFHDLEHTLGVTRTAVQIGQAMGLGGQDLALLEIAALFHDTGYARGRADHEAHSADIAERFLERHGVAARDRARVRALIMATRMGRRPRGPAQEAIRDADSSKAGQADFIARSEKLRREIEHATGDSISRKTWRETNLAYLRAHRFHTAYARKRYGRQKSINLKALRVTKDATLKRKTPTAPDRFFDRDLSWLSFNDRVLQEAKDPRVPLLERIKFLAIYSSNLDEFYRVRVASLRSLSGLTKAERTAMEVPTAKLIARLNRKALKQQQEFGALYRGTLLPALEQEGIRILAPERLTTEQKHFVRTYFRKQVAPLIDTAAVRPGNAPFIEDRKLYFVCTLRPKGRTKPRHILVNIPSDELGRFLRLPSAKGATDLIFLDDAMRICLGRMFSGHKVIASHAIKLSRDAELYLDEEFAGNVQDKVRKSLRKRRTGVPSRFLHDHTMPKGTLRELRALLGLAKEDLVSGGRYHNFSDLMKLPITGHADLRDKPLKAITHPAMAARGGTFKAIGKGDVLMHFPYHDFGGLVEWLRQAARDPLVNRIAITLYRVAEGSAVCAALMDALERGKAVTVFVEVKARFDERSNLFWGETLERAGAEVLYGSEHLKVHCKLCLIERREQGRPRRYAYLGTGNFNERTATIYSDSALLTARPAITREVAEVFEHLRDRRRRPALRHLLMAPVGLRGRLEAMIDREIEASLRGKPSGILIKLNSLEDRAMIAKLYDAARAGVEVRLIIRGICCLVPGSSGTGDRIKAISIVDRFLEHSRVYVFHNQGAPTVHLSSADLMGRNLDRRIEVAFPLLDDDLKREILDILDLQWKDRQKARVIDAAQSNPYVPVAAGERQLRSQEATHAFLRRKALIGRPRHSRKTGTPRT